MNILQFLEEVDSQEISEARQVPAPAAPDVQQRESNADTQKNENQKIETIPKRAATKRYEQWNTRIKAVEVNRLVWAPTLNYFRSKTGTSAVLFPARIANNAEAACVQINVWPIPPEFVLVEFFDCIKKGTFFEL